MSSLPTRSAVVELKDERRAMHEGHGFLDEKCLLLAGEILRQLQKLSALQAQARPAEQAALAALQAAVARHGLRGLQWQPPCGLQAMALARERRGLMGVALQQVHWVGQASAAAASAEPSPEARACAEAFAAWLALLPPLAAVQGNLERLAAEYRRSVRRARALQDVMLPELDHRLRDIEGRLEELEQEDAIAMRPRRR